jgi:anti-sigma factor RsiW
MITCRELIDFIARYLENDLSPEERSKFDRHLAGCPPCLSYIENYRQTIVLSKAAFGEAPPPMPEDLVKAILAARRKAT